MSANRIRFKLPDSWIDNNWAQVFFRLYRDVPFPPKCYNVVTYPHQLILHEFGADLAIRRYFDPECIADRTFVYVEFDDAAKAALFKLTHL